MPVEQIKKPQSFHGYIINYVKWTHIVDMRGQQHISGSGLLEVLRILQPQLKLLVYIERQMRLLSQLTTDTIISFQF